MVLKRSDWGGFATPPKKALSSLFLEDFFNNQLFGVAHE